MLITLRKSNLRLFLDPNLMNYFLFTNQRQNNNNNQNQRQNNNNNNQSHKKIA